MERLAYMERTAGNLGEHGDGCGSSLVTDYFKGVCVQATGKWVTANRRDGHEQMPRVNWWINCKRASRAAVHERFGTKKP